MWKTFCFNLSVLLPTCQILSPLICLFLAPTLPHIFPETDAVKFGRGRLPGDTQVGPVNTGTELCAALCSAQAEQPEQSEQRG